MTAAYTMGVRPADDIARNLIVIFDVGGTDKTAVSNTFNAISAFVKSKKTKAAISVNIHLGDYIDLPALAVAAYEGSGEINVTNANLGGTKGTKLRLIVVGINSFSTTYSTNSSYNITANNGTPHVVFQFRNLPGTQQMNSNNIGGYAATIMRKYFVSVSGVGGNFYNGLIQAGVPEGVLWGPKRSVAINYNDAAGATCNVIEDLLWLPTERELIGDQIRSPPSETAANQARLEYYDTDAKRVKYDMSGTAVYWYEASHLSGSYGTSTFTTITSSGNSSFAYSANHAEGAAPAFCVK
jgi:hypothetical protein